MLYYYEALVKVKVSDSVILCNAEEYEFKAFYNSKTDAQNFIENVSEKIEKKANGKSYEISGKIWDLGTECNIFDRFVKIQKVK